MFESVALPESSRLPAMHSGGLAIPYVQEKARLNKPPLVYWLQAASAAVFTAGDPRRDAIWMYRIPGVLCAIGAVLATWGLARSMTCRLASFLAAAGLAVCPVVALDAHQARADQLLLLTVVLTQWALWRNFRGRGTWTGAAALWLCVGIGILAKGPITPMIAGLTALALCVVRGEWRWLGKLKPALGVLIVPVVVGPWVYAVASRVGFGAYFETVWNETIGRSVEGREGHWGPPGYHLLLVFFLLWPVSLGLPVAAVVVWKRIRGRSMTGAGWFVGLRDALRRRPAEAFLISWIVPAWIVFECVSTKLPHYTLPLYPALCILSARALVGACRGMRLDRSFVRVSRAWFGVGVVAMLGVGVLAISAAWWEGLGFWGGRQVRVQLWWMFAFGAMMLCMALAGRAAIDRRFVRATVLASGGLVCTYWLLLGGLAPQALSLSTRILNRIDAAEPTRPITMQGYQEDSLIFLTRGTIRRTGSSDPAAREPGSVLVTNVKPSETQDPKLTSESVRGFNIAKGRCETVWILKKRAEPTQ